MVVDLFLVYQFIRRLATPFEKWDAYKEGIIDKNGKVLIKRKNFTKGSQNKAWGIFDIMIANLKKLLGKIPGGKSRLASYAAALFLIKEYKHFSDQDSLLTEDFSEEDIKKSLTKFIEEYSYYLGLAEEHNPKKKVEVKPELEEEPTNNVGSGEIAGMDGTHMSKAAQKRWTSKNKSKKKSLSDMLKRVDNTQLV